MELSDQYVRLAKSLNMKFSLNSRPISYEEVFSMTGLLPAIARRADQLCSLCLGYGIGATFEDKEGTVLGVKVIFDTITPTTIRHLCILDVLLELTQNTAPGEETPLDELMYD